MAFNPFSTIFGGIRKFGQALIPGGGDEFRTPDFNPATPTAPTAMTPRIPIAAMPSATGGPPLVPAMRAEAALAPPPPAMAPPMDLNRAGVPIPQLPGRPGEPQAYDPIAAARYDHVMQGAKRDPEGNLSGGFHRSWKDTARNALAGFVQGAASNRENPLAAGFGGAAAAGIGTAINPMAGREYGFDTMLRPRMEADEARGHAEQDRLGKLAMDALRRRQMEAGIGADVARADQYRTQAGRPMEVSPGASLIDPVTGQIRATAPNRPVGATTPARPRLYNVNGSLVDEQGRVVFAGQPKAEKPLSVLDQRRAAEGEEDATEGTVESIAQASTEARRGEVIERAPEKIRSILKTGKTLDGEDPLPEDMVHAQTWLSREMDALYKRNLNYTKGERAKKIGQRVSGGLSRASASAKPSTAPRNVSDLLKYLP